MTHKSYEFFLIPEQRVFQNGLDGEFDAMAAKFKLALDDVVPAYRANALGKVEMMSPKKPLVRYDAPWEANESASSNGHHRWEYEIHNGKPIADIRFEKYLLSLRVRFTTFQDITQEQFDAVLRKYAEHLRSPAAQ